VFRFTAAYLLSGDEGHVEAARQGVEDLLAHAWDDSYGGWYDRLTVDGEAPERTKTAANELYTHTPHIRAKGMTPLASGCG
jgi:mannose/cellobiose epimerase-like protein (N-acyl-D-glucosamine 2-epimerase family)